MKMWKRISRLILGALLWSGAARAGEPLSLGAIFGPRTDEIVQRAVPAAMDMAQKACQATAKACSITPVKVADLPLSVRADLEALFPAPVLEKAQIYLDMPLNDPSMGIGFINTLGMIAAGGGTVMGMTFGDEVYMAAGETELVASEEWRGVLAHELVHVSQYQTLGYEAYKEMYAKETAHQPEYKNNGLEKEAFLFQHRYPHREDDTFFSYYPAEDDTVHVRAGSGVVDLADVAGADTADVDIVAGGEFLPRTVKLLLGGTLGAGAVPIPPQILNPHGGEPLHIFDLAGSARLLSNDPTQPQGSRLVAVASDAGVEVAWRAGRGFESKRFGPAARIEDIDGDEVLEVVEPRPSGARSVWRWDGRGFRRD